MTTKVTQHGNGFFTADAEYLVRGTDVVRGDGSYTCCDTEDEAAELAEALANEWADDADCEWIDG